MHQDDTQVLDRPAGVEFVESRVGQWPVVGEELTEHSNPLRTAQQFQGPFRRVVDDQKVPKALQLNVNLAVGAAHQIVDPRLHGAGQAPGAAEQQVYPPAVLACPVAIVTGTRPTYAASVIVDADE